MTDIPEDVMKLACAAMDAAESFDFTADIVARAIMAERERCAAYHDKIAERLRRENSEIMADGGWQDASRIRDAESHSKSAVAIRKGEA